MRYKFNDINAGDSVVLKSALGDGSTYTAKVVSKAILVEHENEKRYILEKDDRVVSVLTGVNNDDFIARLEKEDTELVCHIDKLQAALNSEGFKEKVGPIQYVLMEEQLKAMKSYLHTLDIRICELKNRK